MEEKVVVTRHPALVRYLQLKGVLVGDEHVVLHATEGDVAGKHVIGVLPFHLAALAKSITVVDIDIPQHMRGRELTLEEVAFHATGLREYVVNEIKRS